MSLARLSARHTGGFGRVRSARGLALAYAVASLVIAATAAAAAAGENVAEPASRERGSDRERERDQDRDRAAGLRWVRPYEPGKVPVVFIHGMLGTHANWSPMIDELTADETVRTRFQFLSFAYDSFQSIPESGQRLVEALNEARRRYDHEGHEPGFDRMVLVGHSMGGLLAKVVARGTDNPVAWAGPGPGPAQGQGQGQGSPDGGQTRPPLPGARARAAAVAVGARVGVGAGVGVGRLVFIATPHRGTAVDQGALRSLGNWFARTASPSYAAWRARGGAGEGPATSVDQLAWDHPLLTDLQRAGARPSIPYHSIIAALGDPAAPGATDGVVPVQSARLENARSELVVPTHHFCFQHPAVIREVHRVLLEHAAAPAPAPATAPGQGLPTGL